MTKLEAIDVIVKEARSEKSTRQRLNKLRKAMAALGLSAEEQVEVEVGLEYRKYGTKELYSYYLTDKEKASGV
jgi:hypothetical protein